MNVCKGLGFCLCECSNGVGWGGIIYSELGWGGIIHKGLGWDVIRMYHQWG